MRRYYLASAEQRGKVDLTGYADEIVAVVKQIMPHAVVEVKEDCYVVTPTPTRSEAIKIGKMLSKNEVMGRYCIQISKLFCSEEVENGKEVEDGTEEKRIGGHQ